MRELKARQTVMVALFGANVALTFANSTIFSLFHFHRASGFFSFLARRLSFVECRWDFFY